MVVKVNPVPLNPPPQLFNDDIRGYIEQLTGYLREQNQVIHDLRLRTGGDVDTIADIETDLVTQDGGNRSRRYLLDQIDSMEGRFTELKRHNRRLEQQVEAMQSQIDSLKSRINRPSGEQLDSVKQSTRTLEQKLNELTERYDSGT